MLSIDLEIRKTQLQKLEQTTPQYSMGHECQCLLPDSMCLNFTGDKAAQETLKISFRVISRFIPLEYAAAENTCRKLFIRDEEKA